MSLIEFKDVTYIYDKKNPLSYNALDGVSFSIEEGEFLALVGQTGSGKSTLVQTLNALLLPENGFTRVDKFYITKNKELRKKLIKEKNLDKKFYKKYQNLRKKVGIVFQFSEYQLFADNVLKDVSFGPKNFGLKEEEATKKAKEALEEVGIDCSYYDRSPFELSGGEKRRIAIAGILASSPDILVLDEPTVGLDPKGKREILKLIDKINQKGVTIIIVTHDMDVVMNHASKVSILQQGKLVKVTTPHDLFKEDDIDKYSLEIPTLYKFIKLLKEKGYPKDLSNVKNLDELLEVIK